VIATGTPEEVARAAGRYTGEYLAPHLRMALPKPKKRA
jgi:excinuclease UvrABC ATPase subunit